MTSHPKILFLVWNLIRGGTEGQCARAALELSRRGYPIRVAAFRREGFFLGSVERACGPVYEIGIQHLLSVDTVRRVGRLRRWIREEKFDLVHAWDADAAIFGQWAAAGIPFITSRRDLGQIYPAHKTWLMNRADRKAGRVVVNAGAISERVMARGIPAEKICRITNMLDVAEFDRAASAPLPVSGRLPAGRLVGMVTRLDPEKDTDTYLRAAQRVIQAHDDARFVVAGDGRERHRLEQMARDLGVESRVIFLGDVSEVPALLRRMEIGVMVPKSNEGLSNTILEYQAASLPVVATDCGGNHELLDEGRAGMLVPPGDDAAAAQAIEQLLSHPEQARQMGRAGRQGIEQRHRPETVAAQLSGLYRQILIPQGTVAPRDQS